MQRALLSMITEKLVGSHLRRMLDNDDHDSTRRGYYVPGLVHYPAQFYLAKLKPDGSVEYFTDSNTRLAHRDSIYAEFYGEFTEFRTKASAQGKGTKRRRPVVIFDDKTFPRFRAVPCSTAGGDVRIRFVGHFSFKPSYTVHRFPVDLKPCMVEGDPDAYPILAVTLKDLDRVLARFEE